MRLYLLSNSDGGVGSVADAPLLGVASMSAGVPSGAEDNGTRHDDVEEALSLLKQALDLLDKNNAPPEIAARVQQAIDSAEEWRST